MEATLWYGKTRLHDDRSAQMVYEKESRAPGDYLVSTPGFNWHESPVEYSRKMVQPMHQRKQYRSGKHVDTDSKLRYATMTDPKYIHQLNPRPAGHYKGAGQPSASNKVLESELIMGVETRGIGRACDVLSGVTIDRFHYLPEHGNPQRVQHVVPTWIRGGDNTRDHVRRINYDAKMRNKETSKIVNK